MGQRLLALVVLLLALAIVLGSRVRESASKSRPPASGETAPASPPLRDVSLRPLPDAAAPEIGTPGIDLLAILAVRRRIAREGSRVYLDALLAETDSMVVRWPDRATRSYTVAFFPDTMMTGWSTAALSDARTGMQRWAGNSAGIVLSESSDTTNADITIHWSAVAPRSREAGATSLTWGRDGIITHASMQLALRFSDSSSLTPAERQRTAAHEFGHALGLPHSLEPEDLMFAKTELDGPSRRDNATLLLLYTVPPGSLKVP